ncbi:MAG: hypothetical protein EP301_11520 [Gammaproteobacteria bacterium]|nr:MAG: hypothetical protein EP301_11520 [Gammaproteobacteria bacterium]
MTVRIQGQTRELPKSRKTRALLALLALEPKPHARASLCEWIWPDTADPRAGLRWSLTKLRDVLPEGSADLLEANREAVSLNWPAVRTDIATVTTLLESPDQADLETLIEYENRFERGPLAELDTGATSEFEIWLEAQREAINRLHQQLLAILIERLMDTGGSESQAMAPDYAREQVTLDPLDNAANVQLLTLLFRLHGQQEAQATLARMRKRLKDAGLGDAELIDAWRSISAAAASDSRAEPKAQIEIPTSSLVDPVSHRPLPSRPSVAVLPFEDLGQHTSGGVLAQGIAVDLNARLSQLKSLFVIARASAARFSLAEHDARSIGHTLGVRYLVHGTTQRTEDRIRVTVNLIEAEQGAELWSDRVDRPIGDLFEVQDDLANQIVSTLEPQIDQAEMERVRLLPTESLDAWECFHRAMWHSFRFTADDNALAHGLFQRALEQDPQFARAYAGLSFNHFSKAFLNSTDDIPAEIALALDFAERAVSFDGRDAMGHWALGRARLLNREHDLALDALDRSLIANPNYAQGHYARGFIGVHADRAAQALPDLDMAKRLSPFDPMLFAITSCHGLSMAIQERYEEAAEWAVRATQEPNAHFHIYGNAGACLALSGREEEAADYIRQALARNPEYCIANYRKSFPFREAKHDALITDALARAGLPD